MKSQQITGTTRVTGLIGNPVKHSLSPLIHNHAFASLGLNYVYIPLGVEETHLEELIKSLRNLNFAGANVTIPYKSAIIPYCDTISELSRLTGTVNTLYWDGSTLVGTTTDGKGFIEALEEDGQTTANKNVVILGNGGTARTLAMILAHQQLPKTLTILGRNEQKILPLVEEISSKTGYDLTGATLGSQEEASVLESCDILVNCTPVGMHPNTNHCPIDTSLISSSTYVFDAIYNPAETQLLKESYLKGCNGQNGLRMLLLQGLASFTHWTEKVVSPSLFDLDELQQRINS